MSELNFSKRLLANSTLKVVKKGDFVLHKGDASDGFFYIEKGCLRSYIVANNNKEHIVQFAPEGWIIGDQEAFLTSTPALFTIDAVEDSVIRIIKIPKEHTLSDLDKDELVDMNQKFQKRISVLQKRIIQLLSATAQERYDNFNVTYPNLSSRLPLKMIASYLGITPESLSRVRKERVSKK